MKEIGFLSFGHWTPSSQSQARSAADALLQSVDLAVAAEAYCSRGSEVTSALSYVSDEERATVAAELRACDGRL